MDEGEKVLNNGLHAIRTVLPGIDNNTFNRLVQDHLQAPGANELKSLVIQGITGKVNSMLTALKENKSKVVVCRDKLDVDQEALLYDNYPEFDIKFTNDSVNPHGFAANSRRLELQILLMRCKYDPNFNTDALDEWDDYVCDIGGNFYTHFNMNNKGIHSCCPILNEYDDLRLSTRLLELNKDATCGRELSEWQIETAKQCKSSVDSSSLFCKYPAEKCNRTAKYAIMCHSNYDVPLRKLGDMMQLKKILVCYGSFVFAGEMLLQNSSGEILPLGMCYQYSKNGKEIKFGFSRDSSLNYVHRVSTLLAYATVSSFYSSNYKSKYYLELMENRLGIQFFRVTVATQCIYSPIKFNHKIWFPDMRKKIVVKYYDMNKFVNKYYGIFGNWGGFKDIEETLVFDAELVHAGLAFSLGATEEKFRPVDIFNYLRTNNRRIIFGQRDVLNLTEREEPDRLFKLAYALYIYVYQFKYDSGRLNQALLNGIKDDRELHDKGILQKLFSSKSGHGKKSYWFPSIHKWLYDMKKSNFLHNLDISKHIQFIDFESGGYVGCEKIFYITVNKVVDAFSAYHLHNSNEKISIPDFADSMFVVDIKSALVKVLKDSYGLDVSLDPAKPSDVAIRSSKKKFFEDHKNNIPDNMSEFSSMLPSVSDVESVMDGVECDSTHYHCLRCSQSFILQKVLGDGRCTFYALNGGQEGYMDLVNGLKRHSPRSTLFIREDFEDEIDGRTNAGFQVLLVYSEMTGVKVKVHRPGEECLEIGDGDGVVHLLYNGFHYDRLWPESTECPKATIEEIDDEDIEVASEASSYFSVSPLNTPVELPMIKSEFPTVSEKVNSVVRQHSVEKISPVLKGVVAKNLKTIAPEIVQEKDKILKEVVPIEDDPFDMYDDINTDLTTSLKIIKSNIRSRTDLDRFVTLDNTPIKRANFVLHFVHNWIGGFCGFAKFVDDDMKGMLRVLLDKRKQHNKLLNGRYFFTKGTELTYIMNVVGSSVTFIEDLRTLLGDLLATGVTGLVIDIPAIGMGKWNRSVNEVFEVFSEFECLNMCFVMHVTDGQLYRRIVRRLDDEVSDTDSAIDARDVKTKREILALLTSYGKKVNYMEFVQEISNTLGGALAREVNVLKWMYLNKDLFVFENIDGDEYISNKYIVASSTHVTDMVQKSKKNRSLGDDLKRTVDAVKISSLDEVLTVAGKYASLLPSLKVLFKDLGTDVGSGVIMTDYVEFKGF